MFATIAKRRAGKQATAQQNHLARVDAAMSSTATAFKNSKMSAEPGEHLSIYLILAYFTILREGEQAYKDARIKRTFSKRITNLVTEVFKQDNGIFNNLHIMTAERQRMLGVVNYTNNKLNLP